jgi:hypothetical protein
LDLEDLEAPRVQPVLEVPAARQSELRDENCFRIAT